MKKSVDFKSAGSRLSGDLYLPDELATGDRVPGVVVGGPMATVKEQAAGVFAEALARRGYAALAFDHRHFGESEGEPRFFENPAAKTEDIHNAISFLGTLQEVDAERLCATTVCASSSYMAAALISDTRIRAWASVSGHFSLNMFAMNPMFPGQPSPEEMLSASNRARQTYYETGEAVRDDMVWPDLTGEEEGVDAEEIHDYYFARVPECWPRFSNRLVVFSYGELLKSHALDHAKFISTPYLGVVGSEAMSRPLTEMFVEGKVTGEKSIHVMDGATHMKACDDPKYIGEATEVIDAFFQRQLVGLTPD
jgi:pimeloyl-ACP methyl ester carboxylesterase